MFKVSKRMEIAGAHRLDLPYESQCKEFLHGHNWIVTVYLAVADEDLTEYGMVMDFTFIKNEVHKKLDHKNLNEIFDFNPTAENISKWITTVIPNCYKVVVQESEGNIAEYINSNCVKQLIEKEGVSPL